MVVEALKLTKIFEAKNRFIAINKEIKWKAKKRNGIFSVTKNGGFFYFSL